MKTLFAALLVSASVASAEVPPLHATVGVSSQLFSARGYDLVDVDDHLVSFRLAAGTTFELSRLRLDVEAAFRAGGTATSAHASVPTSLELLGVEVAGVARWPVLPWLHPWLKVGVGYDWATLTLVSSTRLTQTAGLVAGQAALGVQVLVRLSRAEQRGVFFIADFGAGGVLRPAAVFDSVGPAPVVGPQADPLGARGRVNVGSLPLSGITLTWNAGLRF